ncbi:MAG: CAP domain-containing protein [Erythrobacter sp.]|jgi:hypothetical protein|nr:CAP domain-containing protein [Erythrobacter sp.]
MPWRSVLALFAAAASLFSAPATAQGERHEEGWLAAHNAARGQFGAVPLEWDENLAAEARAWAQRLARENTLRHSSQIERRSRGENLWMGTRGAYSPAAMIAAFTDEARHFTPGAFPNVSRTGNWADVGHYTQIVWPDTRKVGCALASNRAFDVLVCRYWPAGNVWGEVIAAPRRVARSYAPN